MINILRKFQQRFVLITMALVAVVSLIAFGILEFKTAVDLKSTYNLALNKALETDSLSTDLPFLGDADGRNDGKYRYAPNVPTYCVTVSANGYVYSENSLTAQMDEDVRVSVVSNVLSKYASGASEGHIADNDLFYKVIPSVYGYKIAFVDSSSYYQSLLGNTFTLASGWLLLMLALLAATIFLSRYVTKPIAAAWEQQQRFIADASHELKTPLTVILADAAILAKNPERTVAEQQTWVEGISNEAERMRRLTEDMLTLAQADAGQSAEVQLIDIDLSQLVERSVLQFEAAAFERGLLIEEDVEEGLHIMGSQDRVESLVKTLLENACKYGVSGPDPIRVTLSRVHNSAVLSIENSGSEIPAEDLPHVFDRFYRSDKSRARDGESASFGLGLSIAKSTAEMHKGTISASSDQGVTTFTVAIPLVR